MKAKVNFLTRDFGHHTVIIDKATYQHSGFIWTHVTLELIYKGCKAVFTAVAYDELRLERAKLVQDYKERQLALFWTVRSQLRIKIENWIIEREMIALRRKAHNPEV